MRSKDVTSYVYKRYKQQRNRGTLGFGFYVPKTNQLTHNPKERKILRLLFKSRANEVLFHHRYPTNTGNEHNSCHPFTTGDYFKNMNYVFVHNGTVQNADELRDIHLKMGIGYTSEKGHPGEFNDSEALMWDVVLTLEGHQTKMLATGDIAFIAVKNKSIGGDPQRIFWGRNEDRPLKVTRSKKRFAIASESNDKNAEDVVPNTLYWYDYVTNTEAYTAFEIPQYKWQRLPANASYHNNTAKNQRDYYDDFDYKNKPLTSGTPYYDDDLDFSNYEKEIEESESALLDEIGQSTNAKWMPEPDGSPAYTELIRYCVDYEFHQDYVKESVEDDLEKLYKSLLKAVNRESKSKHSVSKSVMKKLTDKIDLLEEVYKFAGGNDNQLFSQVLHNSSGGKA